MSTVKHVQTELDEELYNMLRLISLREGKSLKEVLREAVEAYVEINEEKIRKEGENDPIWKAFGVVELKGRKTSHDDDWGVVEWRSR